MSNHTETKIAKYQWAALLMGFGLLAAGFYLVWKRDTDSILAIVGALGWFSASLLMSPQVREDLLGSRFEAVQTDQDS